MFITVVAGRKKKKTWKFRKQGTRKFKEQETRKFSIKVWGKKTEC